MRRYEVIEVGGKIYEVYRTLPEAQVTRVEDGVTFSKNTGTAIEHLKITDNIILSEI